MHGVSAFWRMICDLLLQYLCPFVQSKATSGRQSCYADRQVCEEQVYSISLVQIQCGEEGSIKGRAKFSTLSQKTLAVHHPLSADVKLLNVTRTSRPSSSLAFSFGVLLLKKERRERLLCQVLQWWEKKDMQRSQIKPPRACYPATSFVFCCIILSLFKHTQFHYVTNTLFQFHI